jgi:hypothetical protein
MKILVVQDACGRWILRLLDAPKRRPPFDDKQMSFMRCPWFDTKEKAISFANKLKKCPVIIEKEKSECTYVAKHNAKKKEEDLILKITRIVKKELSVGKND